MLRGATLLLRLMLWLNYVLIAVFALMLLLSWPMGDRLAARLAFKYGASLDVAQAVMVLRMLIVVVIASCCALHPIFANLLRIVATVEAGDPFVDDNATLLVQIGWALFALQCADLVLGGLVGWMVALKTKTDPATKPDAPETKKWVSAAFAQADADKNKSLTKAEVTGFLTQG